jgi:hypothetical protein
LLQKVFGVLLQQLHGQRKVAALDGVIDGGHWAAL